MISAPLPPNEENRVKALEEYDILDTEPEKSFDDLTRIASNICDVPIALISLIDAGRQWFKSRIGLDPKETSRDIAFCSHAILEPFSILEVTDTQKDDRFFDNPLVTSDPKIRFYAGVPLTNPQGHSLGTLCVIDRIPKKLNDVQRESLIALAHQVVFLMELRKIVTKQKSIIEEKTRVEEALRNSEAKLKGIFDSTNYGIISTDPTGIIQSFNRGAEILLGYSAAELIGKETPAIFHDESEVFVRAKKLSLELGREIEPDFSVFVEKAKMGKVEEKEWTYIKKDGTRFPVLLSVTPLYDNDKKIIGFLGLAGDISDRKKVEIEFRRAKHAAEDAYATKTNFLANMSHEIRTPMNGIIGMTELLLQTDLNEEQLEYARIISTSGENLLTLINDILDFSKIDSGKVEIVNKPFDLHECVDEIIEIFFPKANEKKLDLYSIIDSKVPQFVSGDYMRLQQVITNLISNAVKFTDEGEIVLSVRVLDRSSSKTLVRFSIKDTGIGISRDKHDKLFMSFSQIDSSSTRHYGGTGLGLAISKKLVDLMGGEIGVESQPGVGSDFHFQVWMENEAFGEVTEKEKEENEFNKKTILFFSLNKSVLYNLEMMLNNWGAVVDSADSFERLSKIIESNKNIDVVFVDYDSAISVYPNIVEDMRMIEYLAKTPLIIISSGNQEELTAKKLSDDFLFLLSKPVSQKKVKLVLLSAFSKKQIYSEKKKSLSILPNEFSQKFPARILLAEDNLLNQALMVRILEKMGYLADKANDGQEVLELLSKNDYDLIFMDVQMPGLDGLETTKRIRSDFKNNRPVIIAMTANTMEGDREKCIGAGMDDYISKPIAIESVKNILMKWCKRNPDEK